MSPVRVVLVDDEQLIRSGLRALLDGETGIEVVGEAGDGAAGVDVVRRTRPDVVLMDVRMPLVDGVTATRRIVDQDDGCAVVVLTTFGSDDHVLRALRAGARGFLLKNNSAEALVDAVRRAAGGGAVLDPAVVPAVVAAAVGARDEPPAAVDLTARELDVLRLLARGRSNTEIAQALVVEATTVKTHVARVLAKLGARDRAQAAIAAYELGLVRPQGAWPV
jgi:DNA-binding NarL/FixJ family response regulator